MQLPVDITEVLKIATDMREISSTPIAVSVHIDDTASGVLAAHVRTAFASTQEHTRVTIDYLDSELKEASGSDDAAIIIAGDNTLIGEQAAHLREAGVPVMVVCDSPEKVADIARNSGFEIPPADLVAPVKLESVIEAKILSKLPRSGVVEDAGSNIVFMEKSDEGVYEAVAGNDAHVGEIPLTEEAFQILDNRMGKWIVEACHGKDLAFALSFPFIRRPLALDAITATSCQNAVVGFVPFLPGADMPIMTLNQIKMVLQIATAYGQPLDKDRVKEIVVIVAGAFLCRNIVRAITKVIPFGGWFVSGAMGFAATEAMGRAMIEYFEAGGDIVGVANVLQTARDKSVSMTKQIASSPQGKQIAGRARALAGDIAKRANAKRHL